MIFNQLEFIVFFLAILAYVLLVKSHRWHKTGLLVASYYFYGYWDYRFTLLLLISTTMDYFIGLWLGRLTEARHRKRLVIASVTVNLCFLGFFKYFNFFISSAAGILETFGLQAQTLNIILPVGISFYTFQSLSYTVDVYRGQLKPCQSFTDFALFVSFFPQLVAGPIVRAVDFLPQLDARPVMTWSQAFLGFRQFVFGFFKKVFIADRLASFVDYSFGHAGALSGATLWIAVIAYAIQIFCDFSGYSDMAIGCARILGYEFTRNFDSPYISRSLTEFWRRWHISLSTWLRDYLYIPLGGNRKGRGRTYINLMITMVLGGLWHGASWSFVFWGTIQGVGLALHKFWMEWHGNKPGKSDRPFGLRDLAPWACTMVVVLVSWVFFRANDFSLAWLVLGKMFSWADGIGHFPPFVWVALAMMLFWHIVVAMKWEPRFELAANSIWTPTVLFTMLGLCILFYKKEFQPFIYFQF